MFKLPNSSVFYKIESTIKAYRKLAQKNINSSGHKITIDQVLSLIFISNFPDLPQNKIAEMTFKDNASLTRIIDSLYKDKLLNRTPNLKDRRRYDLEVTEKGVETIDDIIPIIKKNRKKALNGITKDELNKLGEILTKIYTNCTTQKQ